MAQYNLDCIRATEMQLATLVVVDPDNADTYNGEIEAYEEIKEVAKTNLQEAQDNEAAASGGNTVVIVVGVLAVVVLGGLVYWFKCRESDDEKEGGNREPLYF